MGSNAGLSERKTNVPLFISAPALMPTDPAVIIVPAIIPIPTKSPTFFPIAIRPRLMWEPTSLPQLP